MGIPRRPKGVDQIGKKDLPMMRKMMGAMAEGITDEELLETVNEHR
jgi:hypothetical protein